MTEQEIREEIDSLENSIFFAEMKDHLSSDDYERMRNNRNRIRELKGMLENV